MRSCEEIFLKKSITFTLPVLTSFSETYTDQEDMLRGRCQGYCGYAMQGLNNTIMHLATRGSNKARGAVAWRLNTEVRGEEDLGYMCG